MNVGYGARKHVDDKIMIVFKGVASVTANLLYIENKW